MNNGLAPRPVARVRCAVSCNRAARCNRRCRRACGRAGIEIAAIGAHVLGRSRYCRPTPPPPLVPRITGTTATAAHAAAAATAAHAAAAVHAAAAASCRRCRFCRRCQCCCVRHYPSFLRCHSRSIRHRQSCLHLQHDHCPRHGRPCRRCRRSFRPCQCFSNRRNHCRDGRWSRPCSWRPACHHFRLQRWHRRCSRSNRRCSVHSVQSRPPRMRPATHSPKARPLCPPSPRR